MHVDPTGWVAIGDRLGAAYLRYHPFLGTDQEVEFLVDALELQPGTRVLDVGCGPGRHARALAMLGIEVHGVDISPRFVAVARHGAPAGATFEVADARTLPFEGEFDAAISLCQGGFGLVGKDDPAVLDGMARAVRPGAAVALSAFSAYFVVRHLQESDTFDAACGVNHERITVRDEAGDTSEHDMWTSCFTPRELRLLCVAAGLEVEHLWSVAPGAYARRPPDLDHPEWLVVARRKARGSSLYTPL